VMELNGGEEHHVHALLQHAHRLYRDKFYEAALTVCQHVRASRVMVDSHRAQPTCLLAPQLSVVG
jgi:hypothetical protein